MRMFPLIDATTARQSLEEVFSRLTRHAAVDGILLAGSTARGAKSGHNDYDIVCIVRDVPDRVLGINTSIDGTFAEIFFYSTKEMENIARMATVNPSEKAGWIFHWIREGRIVLDRSGSLQTIKERSREIKEQIPYALAYRSWFLLNHDLEQNRRYFRSGSEAYHDALDVRLSYGIVDVLTGYFNLKRIPWRGEKEGLMRLRQQDPVFFDLYREFFRSRTIGERMHAYERVVRALLESVDGLWPKHATAVIPGGDVDDESVRSGLAFWHNLLGDADGETGH